MDREWQKGGPKEMASLKPEGRLPSAWETHTAA